jgi:5-amino-6-(5-phosphoribosylamino)uracil reductase
LHPQLLQQRTDAGKPSQPVYILITHSANLNPEIRFFQQPIKRWLLTTTAGALFWKERQEFERILAFETPTAKVDIHQKFG